MKLQRTHLPTSVERTWWLVDATDLPVGRLASEVAKRLRGKHKTIFTPHLDTGDYVVVVNAEKVRLTAGKDSAKVYRRHSGYPGGLTTVGFRRMRALRPQRVIEIAVKGMLPHNRIGRRMYGKLKVYAGESHPHQPQNPQPLELGIRKVEV